MYIDVLVNENIVIHKICDAILQIWLLSLCSLICIKIFE